MARRELTAAQVRKAGKLYRSQKAFRENDRAAYRKAVELGILEAVCPARRYRKWTVPGMKREAKQYGSRAELRKADSGLYTAMRTFGIWREYSERRGWA